MKDQTEPKSKCCDARIEWYYSSGYGAGWKTAEYGRCSQCRHALMKDGTRHERNKNDKLPPNLQWIADEF